MVKNVQKLDLIQIMIYLLGKSFKMYKLVIVIRSAFNESKKYYAPVSLSECLHKLVEEIMPYKFIVINIDTNI